MCLKITEGFQKDTIYVYDVETADKSKANVLLENYEVISKVYFYQWSEQDRKFIKCVCDRRNFAKSLYEKKFKCFRGIVQKNNNVEFLCKITKVLALFKNNDYWITTAPDNTTLNNLLQK